MLSWLTGTSNFVLKSALVLHEKFLKNHSSRKNALFTVINSKLVPMWLSTNDGYLVFFAPQENKTLSLEYTFPNNICFLP